MILTDGDSHDGLERLTGLALNGDSAAAKAFLKLFLQASLAVAPRKTKALVNDEEIYGDSIFSLLAVKDSERILVPVFSKSEFISEWAGSELSFQLLTGEALLKRIPEGWWITFNPGSELGKEFSPWEIAELLQGDQGIDAVVADLCPDQLPDSVVVEPIGDQEKLKLQEALNDFLVSKPDILRLWVVQCQMNESEESDRARKAAEGGNFVVVEIASVTSKDALTEELQRLVDLARIGTSCLRVLSYSGGSPNLISGLVQHVEPIYAVQQSAGSPSILAGVFTWLRKNLGCPCE